MDKKTQELINDGDLEGFEKLFDNGEYSKQDVIEMFELIQYYKNCLKENIEERVFLNDKLLDIRIKFILLLFSSSIVIPCLIAFIYSIKGV